MTEESPYIQEKINLLGRLAMKSTKITFHLSRGCSADGSTAGDEELLDLINHIKKHELNCIDIEEKELERIVRLR